MRHIDRNHRPSAIHPIIANIPAELQDLRQWVLWKYLWKQDRNTGRGEWAKIPMQASGTPAKSNDPSTWSTFKDALSAWSAAKSSFDGLGFMFTPESGIVGVDVDNCVEVDGNGDFRANRIATRVIELLDSYTELSPSGTGIHVLVKAQIAEAVKDAKSGIEIYRQGRYFTVTGSIWSDFIPVQERSEQVNRIIAGIRPDKGEGERKNNQQALSLTTDERLKKAFASANGGSIERLFYGDITEHDNDRSSADLALCSKLAFWSEGKGEVLDAMFRQSRLMRDKWNEKHASDGRTYGEMTISKALADCREFYDPSRRGGQVEVKESKGSGKEAQPQPSAEDAYAARRARRFSFGELYERADAYRKEPATQGAHTGWDNVSEYYRPRKGLFTIITGIPSHGKSSWLNALCFNLAFQSKWKFLFCSFETQPIEQHACDLARIITGKPSFVAANGAATDEEFRQAFEMFPNSFHFAQVPEDDMSVDGVLSYAADAVKDEGIDGFIFDPWSELNPPSKLVGNYTQFVQQGLNKVRRFTRDNNIHTWLVAHPSKFMQKGAKNDVPSLYDIADSAHFYNKADYGIVVHRPDDTSSFVNLHVQKVRFHTTGKKGKCQLKYDVASGRYEEYAASMEDFNEREPSYAF